MTFQTGTSGLEQPVPTLFRDTSEAEVSPGGNVFSYTYLVKDDKSASLVVDFGYYGFGGDKNEYGMRLASNWWFNSRRIDGMSTI